MRQFAWNGHNLFSGKNKKNISICCLLKILLAVLSITAPRKTASENVAVYVVCWIFLHTFQSYFSILANSVDPDQTAPREAVWSGSTLFAKMIFKQMTKQTTIVVIGTLRITWQIIFVNHTAGLFNNSLNSHAFNAARFTASFPSKLHLAPSKSG